MISLRWLVWLGAACAAGCAHDAARHVAPAPTPEAVARPDLLGPVYARGLEGDMREGLRLLREIPAGALDKRGRAQRACLFQRFDARCPHPPPTTADERVAQAVELYREYWLKVLLRELDRGQGEAFLFDRLKAFLGRPELASLDDALDGLDAELASRGYRAITGVTQPYLELMAWRTEEARTFQVALVDRELPVKVVFLRDFASLGWSAFATCDQAYSGGWTTPDALYCVADAYDLRSEGFRVSYLAHEGQHFWDQQRFPKLEQPEMEYRAKLTELALARETAHALATSFEVRGGDSRSAPHSFANRHVASDLARAVHKEGEWRAVPVERINAAAEALYRANTEALLAKGAESVARILPP